uniref:Uncharacterized protein n=1 Tax=Aegilops tauschii subsp. strangulata TaxID=200361 RepID=A0A453K3I7_AEGTS
MIFYVTQSQVFGSIDLSVSHVDTFGSIKLFHESALQLTCQFHRSSPSVQLNSFTSQLYIRYFLLSVSIYDIFNMSMNTGTIFCGQTSPHQCFQA